MTRRWKRPVGRGDEVLAAAVRVKPDVALLDIAAPLAIAAAAAFSAGTALEGR